MKKLVIALVCVSSLSAFADRYGRHHDRHDRRGEHRHGRPVIIMNTCRADMISRGMVVRTFTEIGFNACQQVLNRCENVAARENYIRFSRYDKFYCQVYR